MARLCKPSCETHRSSMCDSCRPKVRWRRALCCLERSISRVMVSIAQGCSHLNVWRRFCSSLPNSNRTRTLRYCDAESQGSKLRNQWSRSIPEELKIERPSASVLSFIFGICWLKILILRINWSPWTLAYKRFSRLLSRCHLTGIRNSRLAYKIGSANPSTMELVWQSADNASGGN